MKFSLRSFGTHTSIEVSLRVTLFIIFLLLEDASPYERTIHQEELWLYKNPVSEDDTVPTWLLFIMAIGVPFAFILSNYFATQDKNDFMQATLCFSLTALLTGTILNILKISVGRPRPDFFYRCFPSGEMTPDLHCNGDEEVLKEGRKSFPSGHSGWIFACFGFLCLYLGAKLQCCRPAGRSQGWRLCAMVTPVVAACVVAITRIQDHKHHTEDVIAGGLIGSLCALLCYHHYYPPLFHLNCHCPYTPDNIENGLSAKSSNVVIS
ncbi:phospholipid phosphatase 5-like [Halichondria panicea]|uniref:phospholipid phosphatase 5-like n=1 Tax=Halichondria panicea TaxID=6063 RepID=UPI00312B3A40